MYGLDSHDLFLVGAWQWVKVTAPNRIVCSTIGLDTRLILYICAEKVTCTVTCFVVLRAEGESESKTNLRQALVGAFQ